jgi:hypothetical protein
MKKLIIIALVLGLFFFGYKLISQAKKIVAQQQGRIDTITEALKP